MESVKLTSFSHGAGCGCKISPKVLEQILHTVNDTFSDPNLLVGNETRDDAAVYAIDAERVIISTTDFFMPIVDDPFDFGMIASVNAISDIYAMGGRPIVAISILGWPVEKLPAEIAKRVIEGARAACSKAGISLAGGHSIDTPEPIFGLAVTGIAHKNDIRTNSSATPGCELYLTKPLGIGILTTAQKKGILHPDDLFVAIRSMTTLNDVGIELGKMASVKALTDVTGFGLLGHLIEMCEGSRVSAEIEFEKVPLFPQVMNYIHKKSTPGGTTRNFESYGHKVSPLSEIQKNILCDPQTSGGLLVAVEPSGKKDFLQLMNNVGMHLLSFGTLKDMDKFIVTVR